LAIPFFVFSLGWLKWYWTILICAGLVGSVYYACKPERKSDVKTENQNEIQIRNSTFFIILALIVMWVWQSGIGGMWAQSEDFTYRNAIFRDIVLRDWPVIYPATGHALVYYIGYWLVPSLFGKLAMCLGLEDEICFRVADGALFIWTVVLLLIVFLLVFITLNISDSKKQVFSVVLFILFSGMDIWGNIGYSMDAINYHLEWWAYEYQYSSFTTCLFWVFNQAIPAWLCLLCILNEKNVKNFVFIGMMCLFSAPIPFAGLFVYCICIGINKGISLVKEKKGKALVRDIISIPNTFSVFLFFPVIATYVLSNAAIQGSGAFRLGETVADNGAVTSSTDIPFSNNPVVNYLSFILIEFGLYLIFTAWKYRKNLIYYITFISLLIIPLLKIGGKKDFAMRASIPALIVVYLLVCKFLMEEKAVMKLKGSVKRLTYIMLVAFLILGCFTPLTEFYRGVRNVSEYGIRNAEQYDNVYTLGCDGPYDEEGKNRIYSNFVAVDLENVLFFKVFCK